jgi:hypothetical protein
VVAWRLAPVVQFRPKGFGRISGHMTQGNSAQLPVFAGVCGSWAFKGWLGCWDYIQNVCWWKVSNTCTYLKVTPALPWISLAAASVISGRINDGDSFEEEPRWRHCSYLNWSECRGKLSRASRIPKIFYQKSMGVHVNRASRMQRWDIVTIYRHVMVWAVNNAP